MFNIAILFAAYTKLQYSWVSKREPKGIQHTRHPDGSTQIRWSKNEKPEKGKKHFKSTARSSSAPQGPAVETWLQNKEGMLSTSRSTKLSPITHTVHMLWTICTHTHTHWVPVLVQSSLGDCEPQYSTVTALVLRYSMRASSPVDTNDNLLKACGTKGFLL